MPDGYGERDMLTTSALGRLANFRDLGGLPTRSGRVVKPGVVFRCGSMHLWTTDEVDCRAARAGPRTLIDLRHEIEGQMFPVATEDVGARLVNIPFSRRDGDEPPPVLPTLGETYVELARLSTRLDPRLLLDTLADPDNLPAIIFCAAGKDRTGVATALLLGALNVADDHIVDDYAMSGVIDPRALGDLYVQHMADMPESYAAIGSGERCARFLADDPPRAQRRSRAFVARLGFGATRIVELERALLTSEVVDQPTRPVT